MENLKRIRLERGLSQNELAALSGVSQRLISEYERGCMPGVWKALLLANALGVTVEEIWFPED